MPRASMTKRDRDLVVELLRCAADTSQFAHFPFNAAADAMGTLANNIYWLASDALDHFAAPGARWCSVENALEAALRVEQGEWP